MRSTRGSYGGRMVTVEKIDKYIDRISWGGRFANVQRCDGSTELVVLKPPSIKNRNFIEYIYNNALIEAKGRGVITRFELQNKLKRMLLWDEKDNNRLNELRDMLGALYDKYEVCKTKRERRVANIIITSTESELKDKLSLKNSLFQMCAENYADHSRNMALVYCCTFKEDDSQYWLDWKDFCHEADAELIDDVVFYLNDFCPLSVKIIREIARSPSWRFRWTGAKNVSNLFGKPVVELDLEQQSLLYWSQVYDSVYEAYEPPSSDVIEDDDALDEWFGEQDKKEKAQRVQDNGKIGKTELSDRVSSHGEVFIVTNPQINPNAPSRDDIDNLNTSVVRKFKQHEAEVIKEKGVINEKDLRDRKNHLARKFIGSKAAVMKANSMGQSKKSNGKILPGETIG